MATVNEISNAIVKSIYRHINCLNDENRNMRKIALENIRNDTIYHKPPLNMDELEYIFSEIMKPLLKSFSDPVEKCREISIVIVQSFFAVISELSERLSYVIPVIVQRLGQQDIIEPSEEIRLQLMRLLSLIIDKSGCNISVYMDDITKVLVRTLIDAFPDIRKESCLCCSQIAKSIPDTFHMVSESYINPLLLSITHQHSKNRRLVVTTIGDVLQHGNGKNVDMVTSHFAQRLFDPVPAVRKAVTEVVGNWLLDLQDRYSFHHKLLPLLLTSITDEQADIRELAECLWHDVGVKYEGENEDDFKDKQDFLAPCPQHYPPNSERPNMGCRVLVNRHASKILPGLMHDVCDWVVETRVKSALLLKTILLNLEEYTTQHIDILLSGLYRASLDEEESVVHAVEQSAELVGYFVKPDVWVKPVLTGLTVSLSHGNILVLANIIRGSQPSLLQPHISVIFNAMENPDVCHTAKLSVHTHLLNCVEAVTSVLEAGVRTIAQTLFNLLITAMALCAEQSVVEKAKSLLYFLAKTLGYCQLEDLFHTHAPPLMKSFEAEYCCWTVHSYHRLIFDTLLLESGPVIGDMLEEIWPIFRTCLNTDKDTELRLKFFTLLSRLIVAAPSTLDSQHGFSVVAVNYVTDIVLPNCVWKAGRTAGAIRSVAVSCLWAMLKGGMLTGEKLESVSDTLLTQILTTMDDDNKSTRLISCRTLTRTFDLLGSRLDQDRLHNLYPDLLKRMDDSSDEIRVVATHTFLAYFDCFQEKYEVNLYHAHLEAIYKGLLVHLDDPDPSIQQAVYEVLERAGRIHPGLMLQELEVVRHKHRERKYCDRLTQHLQHLL